MPSGILCSVTASTIMVVRASLLLGPSACSLPTCRWGIRWSSASRNSTPSQKPANAGKNASFPNAADCSMAGMRRLQIDAATITPAAKPASERWTRSPSDFFIKNTQAAPAVVPRNGIRIPRTVCICLPPGAICSFCSPPRRGIRGDFSDTGPCRRRWCSRICSRSRRWWCAPALRGSAPWMQNPRCKERA